VEEHAAVNTGVMFFAFLVQRSDLSEEAFLVEPPPPPKMLLNSQHFAAYMKWK